MRNLDLYARLDLADAWAILGPVYWYRPSSNLKLMFDRLVCMSGGKPPGGPHRPQRPRARDGART